MIILDSNVLLYSAHLDFPQHQTAKIFLWAQLKENQAIGMPWVSILAFIRLSTAIEEGERFELELQLGGFRPAAGVRDSMAPDTNLAFDTNLAGGTNSGKRKWIWAGVLAFRVAF